MHIQCHIDPHPIRFLKRAVTRLYPAVFPEAAARPPEVPACPQTVSAALLCCSTTALGLPACLQTVSCSPMELLRGHPRAPCMPQTLLWQSRGTAARPRPGHIVCLGPITSSPTREIQFFDGGASQPCRGPRPSLPSLRASPLNFVACSPHGGCSICHVYLL